MTDSRQLNVNSPVIRLQKNRERRLLAGHDWVFSNEINSASLTRGAIESGTLVRIFDNRNQYLATAFYNPTTLVAARIVARRVEDIFDADEIDRRLDNAQACREQIFSTPHYRWVHGESDHLPGLVIDRFGSVLSLQITSSGMEQFRESLIERLLQRDGISGLVVNDDLDFRKLEGLPIGPVTIVGDVPESVEAIEDGVRFSVSVRDGQKTGWFYDQRDNRRRLQRYCHGRSVADLYCYGGGWGIHAALAGASSVVCVDRSESAIEMVRTNATLNDASIDAIQADSVERLKQWNSEQRKFDIVIIDPPALIKRRKDYEAGLQSYYQLNRLAAQAVSDGGLLVSCSCSHHLPEDELIKIIQHAAGKSGGRSARIVEIGGQAADHPIHPAMPETRYLKCIFARIG